MENLRALVAGIELSNYQRVLALQEFKKLEKSQNEMFMNMHEYVIYCLKNGYVTPQVWMEKYKHF